MEFTKEAWENAPEGARLEWRHPLAGWTEVHFVGTTLAGSPVIEEGEGIGVVAELRLRIVLPKRKVTVKLWRDRNGCEFSVCTGNDYSASHTLLGEPTFDPNPMKSWTLLGEHTFEIEGE